MKIMHSISVLSLAALICFAFCTLTSCNEAEESSIRVLREKLDSQIVEQVGKADVALDLLHKELIRKRENWVKIKTLCNAYERKADQTRAEADKLEQQGKQQQAASKRALADRYAAQVAKMKDKEAVVETHFKEFRQEYEQQKETIKMLKDECESIKAMGDLADDLSVVSQSEERLEKANKIIEELHKDVSRASAIIDVNLETIE